MSIPDTSEPRVLSEQERSDRYRKAMESISDYAVFLMDPHGVIIDWNRGAELMKGYPAAEALGQYFGILYPEGLQAEGHPATNLISAAEHGTFQEEAWRIRKDNSRFWAHVEIIAFYDERGDVSGFCKVTQDLTARKEMEDKLAKAQSQTQRILESAHAATWEWNSQSGAVTVSPTLAGALGYAASQLPQNSTEWAALVHADDLESLRQAIIRAPGETGWPSSSEFRLRVRDGGYRWFSTRPNWTAAGTEPEGDNPAVLSGLVIDINERKQAELSQERLNSLLELEKERALVTLGSIADAVISTDKDGAIIEFNPTAARLTGWTAEAASGRFIGDVLDVIDQDTKRPISDFILSCLESGRTTDLSPRALLVPKAGSPLSIEDIAAPIRAADGQVVGMVIVFRDVTESRRMVRDLAHQASHDALTGLANRSEFETRVKRALENALSLKSESALLYMDLDQFKVVNDTCGHKAGDELLRQLSQRFRAHVRDRDMLARLGGDEFGLLVEHCTPEEALHVANKILTTTREFSFPFNGRSFRVGVSIGVLPITSASQNLSTLMQWADHACYTAKEGGRNRIHFQQPGDEHLAQRQNDMGWVFRVGQALDEDKFKLFCQKIVPTGKNGGLHYEILLRLDDGRGGWTLPGSFLPSAERYDLMPAIDLWVLGHAIEWLEHHPDHVAKLDLCTINLSARTLSDEGFQKYATELLYGIRVPTNKLCFEITETAAIANLEKAAKFIEEIKKTGCRFALDDFGTGMSSFSYLKGLPIDILKIDGAFVTAMHNSLADAEMVRSMTRIGHLMGMQTVAEWVGDESTLSLLSSFGVDYVQGFLGGPAEAAI